MMDRLLDGHRAADGAGRKGDTGADGGGFVTEQFGDTADGADGRLA